MIAEISGLEDLTPSGSGFHSGEPTQNGNIIKWIKSIDLCTLYSAE